MRLERMQIACMCGNIAKRQVGTVQHFVGDNCILIHNVPHYHCLFCDKKSYAIDSNVASILKYGCLNSISELDWNDIKSRELNDNVSKEN